MSGKKNKTDAMYPNFVKENHTLMVKGRAYTPPFGAGAGHCKWELAEYVSCSLSWVLQHDWETLHIKELN